jgi:hypothetical protein
VKESLIRAADGTYSALRREELVVLIRGEPIRPSKPAFAVLGPNVRLCIVNPAVPAIPRSFFFFGVEWHFDLEAEAYSDCRSENRSGLTRRRRAVVATNG